MLNLHQWPLCSSSGCTQRQQVRYASDEPEVGWCHKHDPYAVKVPRATAHVSPDGMMYWHPDSLTVIVSECVYCGCALSEEDYTRDHVVPRCRGGQNAQANLAPACRTCNGEKGPLTASEYLSLKHDPAALKKRKKEVMAQVASGSKKGA